eukprot:622140-Pleurochrysis_carterae.AAC.4
MYQQTCTHALAIRAVLHGFSDSLMRAHAHACPFAHALAGIHFAPMMLAVHAFAACNFLQACRCAALQACSKYKKTLLHASTCTHMHALEAQRALRSACPPDRMPSALDRVAHARACSTKRISASNST